jgi:hypothetical protein
MHVAQIEGQLQARKLDRDMLDRLQMAVGARRGLVSPRLDMRPRSKAAPHVPPSAALRMTPTAPATLRGGTTQAP